MVKNAVMAMVFIVIDNAFTAFEAIPAFTLTDCNAALFAFCDCAEPVPSLIFIVYSLDIALAFS